MSVPANADALRDVVRDGYARIARREHAPQVQADGSACCSGGCCGGSPGSAAGIAKAVGYADAELQELPESANLGLSCGNPTALAALQPGETVLDLGSGAGLDCFIAGPRVGAAGRVIGVDMTADMLSRARHGLDAYQRRTGLCNVEFRLGEIEHLPVADASIDVVISNCVLNLSPDKPQVWREIARVLRPGGRVAVSDLALLRPLPEEVRADIGALIGCVAGAALVDDVRRMARDAGLADLALTPKPGYVDALLNSGDPLYQRVLERLPRGTRPADFVTSLDIAARKPADRAALSA